jgi:hypothetical protein
MTKKELDKLSKFVKVVMSHKPKDGKSTEKPSKEMLNDKFVWKAGDLVIEKAPKKSRKTSKADKKT